MADDFAIEAECCPACRIGVRHGLARVGAPGTARIDVSLVYRHPSPFFHEKERTGGATDACNAKDQRCTADAPGRRGGQLPANGPRRGLREVGQASQSNGPDYAALIATGEPYAGMISGRLPLVWAPATVISDSPHKREVAAGAAAGRLMETAVAAELWGVQTEFLMVTPYLIPSPDERHLLTDLRSRGARVRILTNALESAPEPEAHSGYAKARPELLSQGIELYEARALLGNTCGSGESRRIARYGNYALHAKILIFDRRRLFMGSMNFDMGAARQCLSCRAGGGRTSVLVDGSVRQ
jgi:phosphatidylserine/phosphatidylglycerophosphate/cardiolipin synthase-like enzyme